jgi:hypothetical protein
MIDGSAWRLSTTAVELKLRYILPLNEEPTEPLKAEVDGDVEC